MNINKTKNTLRLKTGKAVSGASATYRHLLCMTAMTAALLVGLAHSVPAMASDILDTVLLPYSEQDNTGRTGSVRMVDLASDDEISLVLSVAAQVGGANLAVTEKLDRCVNYIRGQSDLAYICDSRLEKLNAGDGTGFSIGVALPVNDLLELEVAFGWLHGSLSAEVDALDQDDVRSDQASLAEGTADYIAKIQRNTVRAQVFFGTHSNLRWGIGVVGHLNGRYKQSNIGVSQSIADVWGPRFQMSWPVGDNWVASWHFQEMDYDIEGFTFTQDASAIGMSATFYLN